MAVDNRNEEQDFPSASADETASARNRRRVDGGAVSLPEPPLCPGRVGQVGRFGGVAPLDPGRHAGALFAAGHLAAGAERIWTFMTSGPFPSEAAMRAWLDDRVVWGDPLFFTLIDARDRGGDRGGDGRPFGLAAFLNIRPESGVAELGHIWLGLSHQRSPAATEALSLLMRHALDDCRYRRLEWKCDARNQASRRAALRLGFRFEGLFLNHMVIRGRNRDTAWYSILDSEWPAVRANLDRWLDPANFAEDGSQRTALSALNRALWSGGRAA